MNDQGSVQLLLLAIMNYALHLIDGTKLNRRPGIVECRKYQKESESRQIGAHKKRKANVNLPIVVKEYSNYLRAFRWTNPV